MDTTPDSGGQHVKILTDAVPRIRIFIAAKERKDFKKDPLSED